MSATYVPGRGVLVVLEGISVMIPDNWTVTAMERHLAELREFYQ